MLAAAVAVKVIAEPAVKGSEDSETEFNVGAVALTKPKMSRNIAAAIRFLKSGHFVKKLIT